ncbi:MAG: hypothetical protein U5J97_06470 [Trueperaceae bacterium]|nr:hypothetical protein [Trueperaceae bacterium]
MPRRIFTPARTRVLADVRGDVRRPVRIGARSPRRPLLLLAAALIVSLVAGCAPTVSEETEAVTQPTGPLAYVPRETGAAWSYLPDRATLDEARVVVRVEGPTVVDGQVRTAWRMVGRGLEVRWFREHREDGTYLVREERPGTVITFDPPILEMVSGPLRVGQNWTGATTATVLFPEATAENRTSTLALEWVTTVVDRRSVTVAAGTFDVFVLNFTSRTLDEDGVVLEELTQETWFSPYLGEVRTENGFFLVDSNLFGLPREP